MRQMWNVYHDEIPEFLLEFMDLDIMKRIEKVGMNCGCEYTQFPLFKHLKPYSRYDHSVGCALIIWHFTKDKEQTLAGLFHDVATPSFSHVIDFLHKDYLVQESTEEKTEEIMKESLELMNLMNKHEILLERIKDYHIYPIADNNTPCLSSDRLEYTLSNLYNYGICSLEEIQEFYDDLVVGINENDEPELCFKTAAVAEHFALCALKTARIYVADADRLIMQLLSEIIDQAIKWNVLSESDLYTDEEIVVSKLLDSEKTNVMWNQFIQLHEVKKAVNKPETGLWRRVNAKKRWINPMSVHDGRVMDISAAFQKEMTEFLNQSFDEYIGTKQRIAYLSV